MVRRKMWKELPTFKKFARNCIHFSISGRCCILPFSPNCKKPRCPRIEDYNKEREEAGVLDSIKDFEEGRYTTVSAEGSDEEFLRKLKEE